MAKPSKLEKVIKELEKEVDESNQEIENLSKIIVSKREMIDRLKKTENGK